MEQQGTSTPGGVSAADPSQDKGQAPPAPDAAGRIGRGIEANVPGGKDAQQQIAPQQPGGGGAPGTGAGVAESQIEQRLGLD